MKIWVDADACPNGVKEILYRVAERRGIEVVLVANTHLDTPRSRFISFRQAARSLDAADDLIVAAAAAGDLVITADIPLASRVIEGGCHALNPRGERYTPENIRERLAMRDLMETLRGAGTVTGGPAPLGPRDRKAFADALDRWLARYAPPAD